MSCMIYANISHHHIITHIYRHISPVVIAHAVARAAVVAVVAALVALAVLAVVAVRAL